MKARNAGEAKWARKQAGSFKDIRVREAFKTRIGYVHNNQKRESGVRSVRSAVANEQISGTHCVSIHRWKSAALTI